MHWAALLAAGLLAATPARAAESPPDEEPPPAGDAPADPPHEEGPASEAKVKKGVWSWLNVIGFPFYAPETGVGLFVGALATIDMPGNEGGEHPSVEKLAASVTTKGQYAVSLSPEAWLAHDRVYVALPLEYSFFPDAFFGIGNVARDEEAERYTEHRFTGHAEVVWSPGGHLFLGPQYTLSRHHVVRTDPDGRLEQEEVLGADEVVLLSGVGGLLLWDDRDDVLWPTRGGAHRLGAIAYQPAFGSRTTVTSVSLDARQFFPVWLDHVVALQLVAQIQPGDDDLPFQALSTLGGPNLMRGWYGGRLRDRHALAAQVEYRAPLHPMFAVVGFLAAGQVAPTLDAFALRQTRLGGGGGIRVSLRPDQRINIRLDVAYGDNLQFYLQILEAI